MTSWKCCGKNCEVNGEFRSVNAGGVKDHVVMGEAIGYGRCIVKSEIIYFKLGLRNIRKREG